MTGYLVSIGLVCAAVAFGLVSRRLIRTCTPPAAEPGPVIVAIQSQTFRRFRPDPIVAAMRLTHTQRELILDRYKEAYQETGVWPDIKLKAFIETITDARPNELIPVYFAQKRIVLAFAADHGLPWLEDLLTPKAEKSPCCSPEDVA